MAARSDPPLDIAALKARVAATRLRGRVSPVTDRARKLLGVYLDTAEAHGMRYPDLVRQLASGRAAQSIAAVELQAQAADPAGPLTRAACRDGCAFCCILKGRDGGTILEIEARALAEALAPLAGAPDGRAWHDAACPALDPVTRSCRAYAARPMICRTYLSDDADACEKIARGVAASGAGVLGAQGLYLTLQALIRAALRGVAAAPSYNLARVAAAALDGVGPDAALRAARQPPRALEDERQRLAAPG